MLRDSFSQHLHDFCDYLSRDRQYSEHTVKNYRHDLSEFLSFIAADSTDHLSDLSTRTCRQFLIYLSQDRALSPRTVARKLAAFRSMWKYLCQKNIVSENPWEYLTTPTLPKTLPNILSMEQMERFLNSIVPNTPARIRDRSICELLYASGLRVSELVSLDVAMLDFDTQEIRVIGKGNQERIAYFGGPSMAFLRQYLDDVRPVWLHGASDAVFLNQNGGRLSVRSIQRLIKRYAIAAGFPDTLTPHLFRHSFATDLYQSGVNLRGVQEVLGHAHLSTTQVYTHVSPKLLREAFDDAHPRS